jgi:hypothetical protein
MDRVDPVEIHRDVHASSALSRDRQRFLHHRAQPALIDRAHGERRDAPLAQMLSLRLVQVPGADDGHVLGTDRRRRSAEERGDAGEIGIAMSEQMRQRHSVHVAAGR